MFTYNLQAQILGQYVAANSTLFFFFFFKWLLEMEIKVHIKENNKVRDSRILSGRMLRVYSNHFCLIFLTLFRGVQLEFSNATQRRKFVHSNLKNYSFIFDVNKMHSTFSVKTYIRIPLRRISFHFEVIRSKLNCISIVIFGF